MTITAATASHNTWLLPQNNKPLSPCIKIATGTTIKEASKFAARTEVDCTEITMAALTIRIAWAVVSMNNCTKTDGSGM